MRRRRTMSRKPAKPQHRKPTRPKRNNAPTARCQGSSTRADLQEQVSALTRELAEAREQQTATADVLKVISGSTFDLQTVFDTLIEQAAHLCRADKANMFRLVNDRFQYVAAHGFEPEYIAYMRTLPATVHRGSVIGRAVIDGRVIHIHDVLADPEFTVQGTQQRGSFRTALGVPLLHEGTPIGALFLSRASIEPFTQQQIELVATFADQAVIAIENTRLLNELRERTDDLSESLEQQTATSEVLRVISSSQGELDAVFAAMLSNAARLCEAKLGMLYLCEGTKLRLVSAHDVPAAYAQSRRGLFCPAPGGHLADVVRTKQTIHVVDLAATKLYVERHPTVVEAVELGGIRTGVTVPMLRENDLIGIISIFRQEVRPFTDKQIALITNFASQAVIAIENTRLLNELRESLQQQTATANVLKVISRSTFDLPTVLNTLVESAARLCQADMGHIALPKEGGFFHAAATFGSSQKVKDELARLQFTPGRESVTGRALLERRTVHIPDVQADLEYKLSRLQKIAGYRSGVGAPMLRDGNPIGVFGLWRSEVRPFTDKQIELLTTIADQAVIAIENVRLFDEIRDKSRQLAEARALS